MPNLVQKAEAYRNYSLCRHACLSDLTGSGGQQLAAQLRRKLHRSGRMNPSGSYQRRSLAHETALLKIEQFRHSSA